MPDPDISPQTTEFGVVALVLHEHPATLTIEEVIRHVSRGRSASSPQEADRVDSAIGELVCTGVLHIEGERLHISSAALHLHRLIEVP